MHQTGLQSILSLTYIDHAAGDETSGRRTFSFCIKRVICNLQNRNHENNFLDRCRFVGNPMEKMNTVCLILLFILVSNIPSCTMK